MTGAEKKELIEKKMAAGDKRSYWELVADLELELWTSRYKGPIITKKDKIN
jgi:hypothetical protein